MISREDMSCCLVHVLSQVGIKSSLSTLPNGGAAITVPDTACLLCVCGRSRLCCLCVFFEKQLWLLFLTTLFIRLRILGSSGIKKHRPPLLASDASLYLCLCFYILSVFKSVSVFEKWTRHGSAWKADSALSSLHLVLSMPTNFECLNDRGVNE